MNYEQLKEHMHNFRMGRISRIEFGMAFEMWVRGGCR